MPPYAGLGVVLAVWTLLWSALARTRLRGCARRFGAPACAVVLAAMVKTALAPDPVKPVVKLGSLAVWILALLTDRPELGLYGVGYSAMAAEMCRRTGGTVLCSGAHFSCGIDGNSHG